MYLTFTVARWANRGAGLHLTNTTSVVHEVQSLSEIITVKYEDLKADPVKELRRVCEFVGLERTQQVLQAAAESASFGKMQSKEINEGPFGKVWPKDKLFCRRGQVGDYRKEMPQEALECFMKDAAPTLQQFGYV